MDDALAVFCHEFLDAADEVGLQGWRIGEMMRLHEGNNRRIGEPYGAVVLINANWK